MIRLVSIGGSGDCYMVCALFEAFRHHHGQRDVQVVSKDKYAAIAKLFDVPFVGDDDLVRTAEQDPTFQQTYENDHISHEQPFYVHPCFLRSRIRVDKLTTRIDASQADMYRMILQLPLDVPLALPVRLPPWPMITGTVLMVHEAVSWPNTQPEFWPRLAEALRATGRAVIVNNDEAWTFSELLCRCAQAEWVIGPQCGVMSILVTGRFPCRKTLASARLNDSNKKLGFLSPQTFPYAYVTKFSNADYDVEEFEITDDNHEEIVAAIVGGQNALRVVPHDPKPVMTIHAPLSPGDFFDRLAVLTVKRQRFSGEKRAAVEREYRRFCAIRSTTLFPPEVEEHFAMMVAIHEKTFDVLERMVPAALSTGAGASDHDEAVRLNRDRIVVKLRMDDVCRGPYSEVKSYYG